MVGKAQLTLRRPLDVSSDASLLRTGPCLILICDGQPNQVHILKISKAPHEGCAIIVFADHMRKLRNQACSVMPGSIAQTMMTDDSLNLRPSLLELAAMMIAVADTGTAPASLTPASAFPAGAIHALALAVARSNGVPGHQCQALNSSHTQPHFVGTPPPCATPESMTQSGS